MRQLSIFLLLMVAAVSVGNAAPDTQKYTCPMHPHYIADAPGTCPICGMDLVPVEAGPQEAPSPAGDGARAAITIAPEMVQKTGVRTAPVDTVILGRTVRSFGTVSENTRLQSVVALRVEGWIEELGVEAVGDPVGKGDLLFKLYSPDLVAAQQDYLAAGSAGRRRSAERRLAALGVQARALEELRRSRRVLRAVPFYAEREGIISELKVSKGSYLNPGQTAVVVQDYSSVWVVASVAEQDLPLMKTGLPARLELPGRPGEERKATVDYVYPTVDAQSRTGKVRVVIENPEITLRPGAYADVTFDVARRERLAIPSEAILRDSRGEYVVQALGGGRFQPRRIRTGVVSAGYTEVLAGLDAGNEVVVSGQFLLDSESALRESFRKMTTSGLPLGAIEMTATDLSLIDHFVDAALYLHETLTRGWDITPGYLDAALQAGERLRARFENTALVPVLTRAEGAVRAAQKARSEAELRAAFDDLVKALKPWITEGRPAHYREMNLRLAADHKSGRLWVQEGGKLANPYGSGTAHEIPIRDEAPERSRETAGRGSAGTGHEHY